MPTGFGYAGTLSPTAKTTKAKKKPATQVGTTTPRMLSTSNYGGEGTTQNARSLPLVPPSAYTGQTIGYTPSTYTPSISPATGNFTLASENTQPGGVTAYGGPGGAAAVGGTPSAGNATNMMAPFTGFAHAFRPEAAPAIFQDPQIALQQVMRNQGLNPASAQGLYQMGLPFADYANALSMLGLGGVSQDQFANGSVNNALNFMGNYFKNIMTPGGQGVDFNAGLKALQQFGGKSDTVLGDFLNQDDPAQQVKNFKSLALPLAAAGLSPLFARAFENAVNQQGDQYLWSISGPGSAQSNFTNYFNKNSSLF